MASIDINYKVQGLDPLTEAVESLIAVFSNVGNNLGSIKSERIEPLISPISNNSGVNTVFEKSIIQQSTLSAKLEHLINSLDVKLNAQKQSSQTRINEGNYKLNAQKEISGVKINQEKELTNQRIINEQTKLNSQKQLSDTKIIQEKTISDLKILQQKQLSDTKIIQEKTISDLRKNDKIDASQIILSDKNKQNLDYNEQLLEMKQKYKYKDLSNKLLNTALFGIGTSAIYSASRYGSIAGNATGSINTTDYNSFIKNQYNKTVSAEQTFTETGVGIATILGASSLAKGGLIGKTAAIGVTALGGIAEYLIGKRSQENIELNNKVTDQDLAAWRFANSGISPYDSATISSRGGLTYNSQNGKISQLQRSNMGNVFDPSLESVMFAGRRDVINGMSSEDKKSYNNQINMLSRLTGNPNVQQLSSVASQISSVTGQNPLESIKNMTNDYVKFGGDTATNTAKMVQIMQSSPIGLSQAHDLVNRYQFNDPMMQNKIAQSTATIPNKLSHYLLMKMGGTSEEQARSGEWSSEQKARYAKMQQSNRPEDMLNPFTLAYELSNAQYGTNRFATESGSMNPFSGTSGDMSNTGIMNKMVDQVTESIKKLNINEQTVHVTGDVIIHGNPTMPYQSLGDRLISGKNMQKGLPNTGTGYTVPAIDNDIPPITTRRR